MRARFGFLTVLLATTAAVPAYAQSGPVGASPDQGQDASSAAATAGPGEIVVTGIRQSLKTSAGIKRNAGEVVDSITADDIGKLPDANVASTLTRVPGVQAYRFGGEAASPVGAGSGLTIRGLTNQTASRVDGRAYFTAGQREFNVEGASPGMVAGIDVYKNPSAEHIEGAIGGLVDIRTHQPFDFKGTTVTAALGGNYNDLGRKLEPDVFGLASSRWNVGGGEMGLLVSGNYSKTFNRGDNTPANGGTNFRRAIAADSAEYAANPALDQSYAGRSDVAYLQSLSLADVRAMSPDARKDVISSVTEAANFFQEDYMRTRKGLDAAFQWKFSPKLEFYADGTYNYYQYHQRYRFLFTADSPYVQNLQTTPFDLDENLAARNSGSDDLLSGRYLSGGTFLNSGLSTMGGEEHRVYQTAIFASGLKWHPTDHLDANLDLSYITSKQTQDNRDATMASRTGLTWNLTRDLTAEPHQLSIDGPALDDPSTWVFNKYDNGTNQKWKDDGIAAALALKYSFDDSFLKDIKVGARYATHRDHYFNYSYGGKNLTTDGKPLAADQSNAIPVSDRASLVGPAPTNFMNGDAGYAGGYLIYDPDALSGNTVRDQFTAAGIPANDAIPENMLSHSYFDEKTYGGYAMADFSFLGDAIRGNVGVRVVKTDTLTRVNISDTSSGTPVIVPNSATSSYTNALPSFNITGSLTHNTLLRFGYGKGLTRPDLGALNPTVNVNTASGTGNVGNPDLKPQTANSFDLSLEHYFSPTDYASVDLFYKDIQGFFSGITYCQTVATAPAYSGSADNSCPTGQYLLTQTVNAQKGYARGVEVALQTFFDYDFVPKFLHDFGTASSFTYVETNAPLILNGVKTDMPQPFTSKYNYALSGFYDDGKLSARVIYTWRSDSILFGASTNPIDGRYIGAFGLLDASLSYKLPQGVSLSINASNLTNAAANRFVGEPAYATGIERQHFVNGRNFSVSLRYTFGG